MGEDIVTLVAEFGRSISVFSIVVLTSFVLGRQRLVTGEPRQLLIGMVFGIAAAFGMMSPIVLGPGLIFDLRAVIVGLSVLFTGPWGGLICTLIAGSFRAAIGGAGLMIGLLAVAVAFLSGLAVRRVVIWRSLGTGFGVLAVLGVLLALTSHLTVQFLPEPDRSVWLSGIAAPQAIGIVLATILMGGLMLLERHANQLADEIEEERRERRRVALDLAAGRVLLETLMEAWPDIVFVKDRDLRFIAANQATARYVGAASPSNLIGRSDADFFPEPSASEFRRQEERLIETGEPLIGVREKVPDDWPRQSIVQMTKLPYRDSDGRVIGLVGIGRDVTADVLAESRMARVLREMEAANRAKSTFLATMSHELRTPLNAVIGFSDLLDVPEFASDPERVRGYARDIGSAARHLLALINDLLDVAMVDVGELRLHLEATDPSDVIRRAARLLAHRARQSGVRLEVEVPPLPSLMLDPTRIRQVLFNLLSNAIKFTPAGGLIRLKAKMDEEWLEVRIEDNGPGIAADRIEAALEPFGRPDKPTAFSKGGVGIGLPLSRSLVELHGGRLWIESNEGEGTTVTFRVPAKSTQPTG